MTDLDTLKNLDEKTRQLIGLYAAEKARADKLAGKNICGEVSLSVSAVGCDVAQAQIIGFTASVNALTDALKAANNELERHQTLLAKMPEV